MASTYRIKRRSCGDYEVHRRVCFIFWIHDGADRRLKSMDRSTRFTYWYNTYEQALAGVEARQAFDEKAAEEGGVLKSKMFYNPFPLKES